jgi:hypothetical protein
VSSKAHTLPLDALLSKDITIRGFNLNRYLSHATPAEKTALITSALGIASKLLLAVEPFGDFNFALKRSLGQSAAPRISERFCGIAPKCSIFLFLSHSPGVGVLVRCFLRHNCI